MTPAEVMRLHVHHGDALVFADLRRSDVLDVQIEQIDHPDVFRTGHAFQRGDDAGLTCAAEHVAQCEAARKRIGIRFVVQKDQHPVRIAEESLILLHFSRVNERLNSVSNGPPNSSDSAR